MLYEFEVPTFLVGGQPRHRRLGRHAACRRHRPARLVALLRLAAARRSARRAPLLAPRTTASTTGRSTSWGWRRTTTTTGGGKRSTATDSFIAGQLAWLDQDLAAAAGSQAQVLFYHSRFPEPVEPGRAWAWRWPSGATSTATAASCQGPPFDICHQQRLRWRTFLPPDPGQRAVPFIPNPHFRRAVRGKTCGWPSRPPTLAWPAR